MTERQGLSGIGIGASKVFRFQSGYTKETILYQIKRENGRLG